MDEALARKLVSYAELLKLTLVEKGTCEPQLLMPCLRLCGADARYAVERAIAATPHECAAAATFLNGHLAQHGSRVRVTVSDVEQLQRAILQNRHYLLARC